MADHHHQLGCTTYSLMIFLLILFLFLSLSTTDSSSSTSNSAILSPSASSVSAGNNVQLSMDHDGFLEKECLTAPAAVFKSTVKSTIQEISKATILVSKFAKAFDDFRFSNAINDCVDLLDLSAQELNWTLATATLDHQAAKTDPRAYTKNNISTTARSRRLDDLRSWLSAALGNQDTCIDGFEGTHSGFIKDLVTVGVKRVTSLISDVLGMVPHRATSPNFSNDSKAYNSSSKISRSNLPSWMKLRDRKLLQDPKSGVILSVDAVVAADGSGNFTKIMDAVLAAPDYGMTRYVIYIKRGTYIENVEIKKKKWNLMMIGDGMDSTIISSNRSFIDGWTTFRSATFAISGKGFMARDLTIENTAGPEKHQAVALRSDSDLSVYYRCGIRGYQDTLYAHSLRQFYRECWITGTVDFIFGNGAVVFQNCRILAKKPLLDQKNSITAQGRKDPNQNTGFSIQFCNVSADLDLASSVNSTTQTYLGRPWKQYSRTVFMQSYIGSVVRPEGWLEWQGDFALDTLYYGEYMNYGPGAGLGSRVKWPGFHSINDSTLVVNFTVAKLIDGTSWLPSTGVKFTAGLVV